MKKKALYPGSFDPVTNGHIDILKRASTLFDEVVVSIFDNPEKKPLFSFTERVSLLKEAIPKELPVTVKTFDGLMADFAQDQSIFTIIRGLRAVSDFDYEFQMALTNRKLNAKIDTIFLMTEAQYSYLSSSLTKQLARFNADIKELVPANVEKALLRKYHE